ncbi:hypothetical protein ACN38_g13001, partial [Penicillium nordicum]
HFLYILGPPGTPRFWQELVLAHTDQYTFVPPPKPTYLTRLTGLTPKNSKPLQMTSTFMAIGNYIIDSREEKKGREKLATV